MFFGFFVLSASLLGQIACTPVQPNAEVKTEILESSNRPDGGYQFYYKLSDGSYHKESAAQKEINGEKYLAVNGAFGFIGDDGKPYDVTYNAGIEGFVAFGDHLPTYEAAGVEEKDAVVPKKPGPPLIEIKTAKVENDISQDAIKSLIGG